jgi:hypothetical protein
MIILIILLVIFLLIRKFCRNIFKQGDKIAGFKSTVLGNAMPLLGDTFKEKVK